MFKIKQLILTLPILLSVFPIAGCDIGKAPAQKLGDSIEQIAETVGVSTDKVVEVVAQSMGTTKEIAKDTLDEFENAITTLDSNSAEWQQVLKDLETKFASDVQSTIRSEITNLLANSIGASGAEFRCNVDFIGKRVQESLKQLVAKLLGGKLSFEPVFCSSVPPIIPFQEVKDNRLSAVVIYGYNLTNLSNFKVILVNDGGMFRDVTMEVQNPTNYVLTINLGGNGVPLEPISNELKVEWNGNTIYTIGVSQPHPPTETPIPTSTDTPSPTPTDTSIPPPEFSSVDFVIEAHARSNWATDIICTDFDESRGIDFPLGWRIDSGRGESAHPGVQELAIEDNRQSMDTLRAYQYFYDNTRFALIVKGRICGANFGGPGAIFKRTYRVFLIKPSP